MRNLNAVLITIVIAQFLCTSLWFAGNGVLQDLIAALNLYPNALGHLTTAIQFGFICGTLVFALCRIADKYSPSRVFLLSAIGGAIANACIVHPSNTLMSLLGLRFISGFFLAGVYPVGMKIATDYFDKGLGKALGLLVGALVIGTALPHLLRSIGSEMDWRFVLIWISGFAMLGGLLIGFFVKDGPYRRPSQSLRMRTVLQAFHSRAFRRTAIGYFGHMWELYAFWAFIPVVLAYYFQRHPQYQTDISLWSFGIIGVGGVACVICGYLSKWIGTAKTAMYALSISGLCCVISPILFHQGSAVMLLLFMLIWGMTVVADSPMFSTLVALEASPELRGTALTIVVCIGFAITMISIQLLNWLIGIMDVSYVFLFLVPGPLLGLLAMIDKNTRQT